MGGVQEALARIGTEAYILTSSQQLVNSILANHEQPAVLSAVMKYETTHRSRLVVNDAMDVTGGAGICRGPNNMVGNSYMSIPIAITVEGANILTRSMITFGQGLNRAHPHLIDIVNSIEKGDDIKGFSTAVTGFFGHFLSNALGSLSRAILRPRFKPSKGGKELSSYYEAQLSRLGANFALCADLALVLGGRLKFEEMLSGRFADAFATLYLGYACLWYHQRNINVEGIDLVLESAMESLLQQNQQALLGISENFPIPGIGSIMTAFAFPYGGGRYTGPTDNMRKNVSHAITTPTGIRTLLSEGIFVRYKLSSYH